MIESLFNNSKKLINVENLAVHFHIPQGTVKAVDGISFDIEQGKSLGIVGERRSLRRTFSLGALVLDFSAVNWFNS